jgi:hypothetical protein
MAFLIDRRFISRNKSTSRPIRIDGISPSQNSGTDLCIICKEPLKKKKSSSILDDQRLPDTAFEVM